MTAKGGKRPGAGRKPGASFAQMVTTAQKRAFVDHVIKTYPKNTELTKWVGNQIYGSAPASLDLTSKGKELGNPLLYALRHNHSDTKDIQPNQEN